MTTRGIRGATTIESDTKENVLSATKELLDEILCANPDLKTADIASIFLPSLTISPRCIPRWPRVKWAGIKSR